MNADAQRLGLHEYTVANPNGLHDPGHPPRDMARRLLREFPTMPTCSGVGTLSWAIDLANQDGPLSRRRRHEDRLHLSGRLQCGGKRRNHGGRRPSVFRVTLDEIAQPGAADLFDRGLGAGTKSLNSLHQARARPTPARTYARSAAAALRRRRGRWARRRLAAGAGRGVPLNPNPPWLR